MFVSEQALSGSPLQCVACSGHAGPFLDLEVEAEGYGHLYLCLGDEERPGCLAQAARLAGYGDPAHVASLERRLQESELQLIDLRGKLTLQEAVERLYDKVEERRRQASAQEGVLT